MSKLDELIQELCPDGTEFRKLIEVSDILYGYPCDASKFNEDKNGMPLVRIRDVLAGETSTFTTELVPDDYFVHAGDLLVGMDGNFHVSAWKMGDAILCQRVCKVSSKDENVVKSSFLKHLLPPIIKSIEQGKQSGTVKHLLAKDINAIRIPLPPLPVQQEIVRILDSFTQLTAELTAELTARRKQYEHYGEKILTFGAEISRVQLKEIATFRNGKGHEKEIVPIGKYVVVNSKFISSDGAVKKYADSQMVPLFIDDILMVMSDLPNGKALAKCFLVNTDDRYTLNQRICAIHVTDSAKISTKYLYYYLNRNKQLLKYDNGVDQTNLKKDDILNVIVPVPPIEKQMEIVSILDRFDSLCNDSTSGLPAEIEARQKQYEYYRDKLLSFKELTV